jgi:hypothetical protein
MNNRIGIVTEKNTEVKTAKKAELLLLSTSLLIDRIFLYSGVIEKLSKSFDLKIWASSVKNERYSKLWQQFDADVHTFPKIAESPSIHNYLRRLNDYAWDFRLKSPSRLSMMKYRLDANRYDYKVLWQIARILSAFRFERKIENLTESVLLKRIRSEESYQRLIDRRPEAIVVTGPFQFEQPAVTAMAKKLGIPIIALIPSWDNLSTKNRLIYDYDGYIVWSEQSKRQLNDYYPQSVEKPVYVVGAPQFDVFFQSRFALSRQEFCAKQNLDPDVPIILYALGSPNFLKEHHGAVRLAERIAEGRLGRVQMLVRPHPVFDDAKLHHEFDKFSDFVRVQKVIELDSNDASRSQNENQITEWVNTFRHADVVVNLSSTVTVDAAIFDRPVVNLDFDPQPGQAEQSLVKDINHLWVHFKPIAESGGVWLVNDYDEMLTAIETYLQKPELHREKRRWIAEYVCGYLDGKCGERMAQAVKDFVRQV